MTLAAHKLLSQTKLQNCSKQNILNSVHDNHNNTNYTCASIVGCKLLLTISLINIAILQKCKLNHPPQSSLIFWMGDETWDNKQVSVDRDWATARWQKSTAQHLQYVTALTALQLMMFIENASAPLSTHKHTDRYTLFSWREFSYSFLAAPVLFSCVWMMSVSVCNSGGGLRINLKVCVKCLVDVYYCSGTFAADTWTPLKKFNDYSKYYNTDHLNHCHNTNQENINLHDLLAAKRVNGCMKENKLAALFIYLLPNNLVVWNLLGGLTNNDNIN